MSLAAVGLVTLVRCAVRLHGARGVAVQLVKFPEREKPYYRVEQVHAQANLPGRFCVPGPAQATDCAYQQQRPHTWLCCARVPQAVRAAT